jgi:iron complex outermembrane receptor protein
MDDDRRDIRFKGDYLFFNPKFGINLDLKKSGSVFISIARAHKEPARSDYTDNPSGLIPKPEQLTDMELGWKWSNRKMQINLNGYYMNYGNQLVLTGAVNDVGTPLRTNAASSYRAGVEFSGGYRIARKWQLQGNITWSKNRIKEITINTLDYYDYSVTKTVKKNVPISYSPDVIGSLSLSFFPADGWSIVLNNKYVGKQYLDNSGENTKTLDAYYFSELWVNKRWQFKSAYLELKLQALNLFNSLYNNNGYTYEYLYSGQLTREVYLFPSAPRNFMVGLVLGF